MTNHEDDEIQQPAKTSSEQPVKTPSEQEGAPASKPIATISAQTFSGPLPPPHILAGYEEIQTGLADRIVTMAESQSIHRRSMEKKQLNAQILEIVLGQIFGFTIGAITIGGGVAASIYGSAMFGASITTVGVVALVSVFIYGRKSEKSS